MQPTYMSCLIDDATRYIIHAQFYGDMEQTIVEDTLKKGIQKFGLPRRIYFDYTDILTIPKNRVVARFFGKSHQNIGIVF